jgi:hypothetical protein
MDRNWDYELRHSRVVRTVVGDRHHYGYDSDDTHYDKNSTQDI